jgi:hypothetical protein
MTPGLATAPGLSPVRRQNACQYRLSVPALPLAVALTLNVEER